MFLGEVLEEWCAVSFLTFLILNTPQPLPWNNPLMHPLILRFRSLSYGPPSPGISDTAPEMSPLPCYLITTSLLRVVSGVTNWLRLILHAQSLIIDDPHSEPTVQIHELYSFDFLWLPLTYFDFLWLPLASFDLFCNHSKFALGWSYTLFFYNSFWPMSTFLMKKNTAYQYLVIS